MTKQDDQGILQKKGSICVEDPRGLIVHEGRDSSEARGTWDRKLRAHILKQSDQNSGKQGFVLSKLSSSDIFPLVPPKPLQTVQLTMRMLKMMVNFCNSNHHRR